MTQLQDGRLFDPLYGNPLYPIRGCRFMKQCSYPYCQCDVKYDSEGIPKECRHMPRIDWVVVTIWSGLIGVLVFFWLGVFYFISQVVWP